MRRGTFRDDTVDYAAVGATQAPDLMQYPPERSIPAEESWRIGSGEARFHAAERGAAVVDRAARRRARASRMCGPASGPDVLGRQLRRRGQPGRAQPLRDRAALRRRRHAVRRRRHDDPGRRPGQGPARRRRAARHLRGRGAAPRRLRARHGERTRSSAARSRSCSTGTTTTRCGSPSARSTHPVPCSTGCCRRLTKRRRRELFTRYLRAISPLYTTPA